MFVTIIQACNITFTLPILLSKATYNCMYNCKVHTIHIHINITHSLQKLCMNINLIKYTESLQVSRWWGQNRDVSLQMTLRSLPEEPHCATFLLCSTKNVFALPPQPLPRLLCYVWI